MKNYQYIDTLASAARDSGYASRIGVKNAVLAGVVRIEGRGLVSDMEQIRRKADRINTRIAARVEWLADHPAALDFERRWRRGLETRDPALLEAAWSAAEAQVDNYRKTGWIGQAPKRAPKRKDA